MGGEISRDQRKMSIFLGLGSMYISTNFIFIKDRYQYWAQSSIKAIKTHLKKPNLNMYFQLISYGLKCPGNLETNTTQPEKSLTDYIRNIQIEYNENQILSMKTVVQILENSSELAVKEFVAFTIENRKQRRSIMKTNPSQYQNLVVEYNENIEQILENSQFTLLDALDISRDSFEESVVVLMERGFFQQFFMIQASTRQKMKERIPTQNQVSFEKTKQIIKFQVKTLEQKPALMINIIEFMKNDPEQSQLIPLALSTVIQDLIYEKFQVEEEDYTKNLMNQKLMEDHEVQKSLLQIEQILMQLMGPIQQEMSDLQQDISSQLPLFN